AKVKIYFCKSFIFYKNLVMILLSSARRLSIVELESLLVELANVEESDRGPFESTVQWMMRFNGKREGKAFA
uniref:hypothetical protein n=1 Tax=Natrialba sp. PRR66 TaxID=3098146 RepID=UPI002B1DB4DB